MFLDLKIENVVASDSEWSDSDVASYKAKKDNIAIRLEEYLMNGKDRKSTRLNSSHWE